jgi:N-acetylglucosaminyldiphosphoundecaprenol N-acetyl-beta-D-mannosaminyltransferase
MAALLLRGAEGVAETLARRLVARFHGLRACGTYSPPFRPLTDAEDDALVARINDARPDIVWVGLSTPKQERWMAAHVGRLDAPALDRRRAPRSISTRG